MICLFDLKFHLFSLLFVMGYASSSFSFSFRDFLAMTGKEGIKKEKINFISNLYIHFQLVPELVNLINLVPNFQDNPRLYSFTNVH